MASGSTAGLRVSRALRMPAARWSGLTSASDPFTLPTGVRQASTTNTGLTLTYLRREAYHLTIKHGAAGQDVLGCRAVWGIPAGQGYVTRLRSCARRGLPPGTARAPRLRATGLAGERVGVRQPGRRGPGRRLLGQAVGDSGRDAVAIKRGVSRVLEPEVSTIEVGERHRQPVAEEGGQVAADRRNRAVEGGVLGHVQVVPRWLQVDQVLAVARRHRRRVGEVGQQRLVH